MMWGLLEYSTSLLSRIREREYAGCDHEQFGCREPFQPMLRLATHVALFEAFAQELEGASTRRAVDKRAPEPARKQMRERTQAASAPDSHQSRTARVASFLDLHTTIAAVMKPGQSALWHCHRVPQHTPSCG